MSSACYKLSNRRDVDKKVGKQISFDKANVVPVLAIPNS